MPTFPGSQRVGLIPGIPVFQVLQDTCKDHFSRSRCGEDSDTLPKYPYTSDPLRSNAMIYEYNAAIDELLSRTNILGHSPFLLRIFHEPPGGNWPTGIHPNGTGYQSMANLWFNALPCRQTHPLVDHYTKAAYEPGPLRYRSAVQREESVGPPARCDRRRARSAGMEYEILFVDDGKQGRDVPQGANLRGGTSASG